MDDGERRRWDTDERFTGVAGGAAARPAADELIEALGREGWITEDPDAHLLPHLQKECERPGSPFRLGRERLLPDGVFEVEVTLAEDLRGIDVARAAIRLLSVIAEPVFFVRQVDGTTFLAATGVLDSDPTPFASHGHLVRLVVVS